MLKTFQIVDVSRTRRIPISPEDVGVEVLAFTWWVRVYSILQIKHRIMDTPEATVSIVDGDTSNSSCLAIPSNKVHAEVVVAIRCQW
jgi:hypothetical protein